jgi:hypothetical protein
MTSPIVLLAPLALAAASPPGEARDLSQAAPGGRGVWGAIVEAFRVPVAAQARIERRMVIRVAPLGPLRDVLAGLPDRPRAARLRERRLGRCLPAAGIAGVEIDADDRLLLFMRDQRLVSASLEKICRGRDFYSGFYIERSGDGLLCVGRDMLHSRTGTSCTISRFRQLVPDGG